ncbi:MAG: SMC family ATPase [Chloroflexia bacterium]
MIPVRLKLRNFMCYRDTAEVLDLTNVHLACLSGENGAGKSALLEAITWVLWGKARDRSNIDDDLISKGASEMEIDYHFILGKEHYRVVRKRARKQTFLDIQVSPSGEDGTWRILSGGTKGETQAQITSVLKIDYETFVNSAYILQGRADMFTIKTKTERKQVLADILGLAQYDRFENLAKEEVRDRKALTTDLEGHFTRIDRELLKRGGYSEELEEVETEFIREQEKLSSLRAEMIDLAGKAQQLENARKRLTELQDRIRKREDNMVTIKARTMQNTSRKEQFESLLAQREEIESGYAQWQEAQQEDQRLAALLDDYRRLEKDHSRYEQEIAIERTRLSSQIQQHENKIADLGRNLAGRGTTEAQLSEVLSKLQKLEQLQLTAEDTRCSIENLDVKMRTLTNEKSALKTEGAQIRQKLNMITEAHSDGKRHADCPLCGTDLTADALDRVRRSYQADIDEKLAQYEGKGNQIEEINAQIVALQKRYDSEREQLKPLNMQRQREAKLRNDIENLDRDEQDLVKQEGLLVHLRTTLSDGDYAHEARTRMSSASAAIKELAYDGAAHEAAKHRVIELRPHDYDRRYHQLAGAENQLATAQESLDADGITLQTAQQEQESDRAEVAALTPQVTEFEGVVDALTVRRIDEQALASKVNELTDRRGGLRNKLRYCDELQEEKAQHAAQYQNAMEEKVIYSELQEAFGKNGIQAMIIESAIPEVEQEANALLHRMSDGRMSVEITTQRDAKSSKAVLETLDINISDEMGTRPYELYSGGEAFRVNFAVRIALSKLLARRAGAQLQTLVIDEGFGSQDGQGREKLVGAIRSIEGDFEKILVITHIEELKEEFPVRINIVKTPSGSRIIMGED